MLYFNLFVPQQTTDHSNRHSPHRQNLWATLVMSPIFSCVEFIILVLNRDNSKQTKSNVQHMWQTWLNIIRDIQQTHAWKYVYRWFVEQYRGYIYSENFFHAILLMVIGYLKFGFVYYLNT